MTEKLYYTDSYLTEFQANLLEATQLPEGTWGLILDRTAFYPESGGQPFDTGTLNGVPVLKVQLDEFDRVVHITDELPEGSVLYGQINWDRRFDHMQQHSGEHILTDAFHKIFGAHNIGFHLGAESTQIDFDLESISPEQLQEVEMLANQMVFENRKVSIYFPTPKELATLPIRKAPPVTENVRIIWIEGSDCCPCGGTHVRQTGEVGLIKIRSFERKKQGIRIDVVCGHRALKDFQLKTTTINQLSALVSTPPAEVTSAVTLRLERQDILNKELAITRRELLKYLAQSLSKEATLLKGYSLINYKTQDPKLSLADLAKELYTLNNEKCIFLLGQVNENNTRCSLHFYAAPDTPLRMNELLKSILPIVDGKGGGSKVSAQGGGTFPSRLIFALEEAEKLVLNALNQTLL